MFVLPREDVGVVSSTAAQAEEAGRRRRAQSIEEARVLRHDQLRNKNHVTTEKLSTIDNESLQISDINVSAVGQDNHSNDDDLLLPI